MKCPKCCNPMKPLFTSYFCPWCDEAEANRKATQDRLFPAPYVPGEPPKCDGTYVNGLGHKQKCSIWLGCGLDGCPHKF